jgi:hypothetical protein
MSRLQAAQSVVQSWQQQEIFLFSTMSRLTLQPSLALFSGYQGIKLTTHLHLLLAKDLKQVELYSTPSIYLHATHRGSFSLFYPSYNKTGTSKHKVVSLLHSMKHSETRMTGSSERDYFYSITPQTQNELHISIITDTDKSGIGRNMWQKFFTT